jgi:phage head maturation protease
MNVVTKSVDAAVSAVESENPNGEFDVILSTEALDRDGEKLYIDEWKQPLPERITFDSDHGMSVATTVGSGVPSIEDGVLRVRGTFASTPHAQNVRTLVNEGHITKTSVAFRTMRDKKSQTVTRELLNGAFVAVPANEEAVVLSSKAAKADDMVSHEQAIHDAAVQLGAMCAKGNYDEKAVTIMDDEDIDPRTTLAGIDAVLDQAQALVVDVDRATLPPEVAQALDMLFGVGPTVDELLEAMGVHDPDHAEEEEDDEETSSEDAGETESAEKSAADADHKSAAAADDSAESAALRARSLAFLVKQTTEL